MEALQEFKEYEKTYPLQHIRINGLNFHYRFGGKGKRTLVLLIGGLGISDLFYKQFVMLAPNYQVLTFNYPLETQNNALLAEGIKALLEELGIQNAFFIGQSYGGLLAQVIAKRHPDITAGLVLSNTGCLDCDMCDTAKMPMIAMMRKLKRAILLTRIAPLSKIKRPILKRLEKSMDRYDNNDKSYIMDLTDYIYPRFTNYYQRHMCGLMVDLMNQSDIRKQDFAYLNGKVLLLLSEDDHTFDDATQNALIDLMPNPIIRTDILGGHLAFILRAEEYAERIHEFLVDLD